MIFIIRMREIESGRGLLEEVNVYILLKGLEDLYYQKLDFRDSLMHLVL